MALITFDDKQAIGTQPSIPDVNKVMDTDINAIKTAINNSTNYPTSEMIVGTWNGKPLYRKLIEFGALPNNTSKSVNTGLNPTAIKIRNMYGVANYANGVNIPLPYPSGTASEVVKLSFSGGDIDITTNSDRSSSSADIVLEYTKNSD